jgi:GMP synthase-like glutamine amidotransferase
VRVLSITHGPSVGGGVFEETAERLGHTLERWTVQLGSAAPSLGRADAIFVFGGSMHPDQDEHHPWLPVEAGFLRSALHEHVPVLGVSERSCSRVPPAPGSGRRPLRRSGGSPST